MRTFYLRLGVFIFLCLGTIASYGQVKIGANPQNIDLASILELESTSKVLVISRVNTAQMGAIVPLEGAMVYNIDAQCLHYYDGTEWINICEAFGNALTFTSNSVANSGNFETIKITQTDNNYNFEVGLLNASNIQDGTIDTPKIVNGAVTLNKLATNSVNSQKIADKSIQTIDIAPGLPNTVLQTNNTGSNVLWAQLDASTITGRDLTEGDGSITITNGQGATLVDTDVRVTDLGITAAKLADGAVENLKLGIDAVTTDKIFNETILSEDIQDLTILEADLSDDAITNVKVADNAINTAEIVDDAVTAIKINNDVAGTGLIQAADGSLEVDVTALTGDGTISSTQNTIQLTGTTTNALFEDIDIDVADDAIDTAKILNETILSEDIFDGSILEADLSDNAVTPLKIDATLAGTGLSRDAGGILSVDGTGITGDGTISSPDATILITGTPANSILENVELDVADNAITSTKVLNETILSEDIFDGTIATLDLADGAVTNPKLATDAVTTDKILNETILSEDIFDGTITNNDILDRTISPIKFADGTADGEILQWDGTNWVLVDDSALSISEADGIIGNEVIGATNGTLTRGGSGIVGDEYTLGVSPLGITDAEIAANAVTLPKLADGTTAGQLMQWDGTDWVLVDDSTLTITETDGIIGNEVVGATNTTLTLGGTGIVGDEYTLGVSPLGITDTEIAANAVTPAKIAPGTSGQVLTTVGANVAWQAPVSPFHALGKMNAGTAFSPTSINNVASINVIGIGNYQVNFSTPATSSDYIIQLTLFGAPAGSTIQVTAQTINNFTVQISQTTSTLISVFASFITNSTFVTTPNTVDDHEHTGQVDPFNEQGIAINPIDAQWYFTVTDF